MMAFIEEQFKPDFVGKKFTSGSKSYVVKHADNYSYKDPIVGFTASKQVRYSLKLNYSFIKLL